MRIKFIDLFVQELNGSNSQRAYFPWLNCSSNRFLRWLNCFWTFSSSFSMLDVCCKTWKKIFRFSPIDNLIRTPVLPNTNYFAVVFQLLSKIRHFSARWMRIKLECIVQFVQRVGSKWRSPFPFLCVQIVDEIMNICSATFQSSWLRIERKWEKRSISISSFSLSFNLPITVFYFSFLHPFL